MMKRWLGVIFGFCVLLCGAAGYAAYGLWVPANPNGSGRDFEVAPGEVLNSVAQRMKTAGLLPDRPLFGPRVLVAFARLNGVDREIKSGEYELSPADPPLVLLERLVSGSVKTHPVTLPEGLRVDQIAARLESAGITEGQAFLADARDPERARAHDIEADSLEGYLYPETYRFRRNSTAAEVLGQMVRHFWDQWTEADRARLEASEMTLHQVVTLASIVEKETSVPEERARIAAVFHNRLKRRMRLQSDPTVIYGILVTHGSFDGNIRRKDLKTDTPYNTYTRGGLPPGPIANPGMAAIRAVLEPEDAPYLYFVSRNDGTHEFSRTLVEHNRAVERFQKRQRRKGSSS